MADKDSLEVADEADRIVTGPPRTDGRPAARSVPADEAASAGEPPPLPTDGGDLPAPGAIAAERAPSAHSDHMLLGAEPLTVADEPEVAEIAERIAAALAGESAGAELSGETRLPTAVSPSLGESEVAGFPEITGPETLTPPEPEPVAEIPPAEPARSEDWLIDRIGRASESHAAAQPVARPPEPLPVTALPEPAPPREFRAREPHAEEPAPVPGYVTPPAFEPSPRTFSPVPVPHEPPPHAYEAPPPAPEPPPLPPEPAPSPVPPPAVREITPEPIRAFRHEALYQPPADLSDVRPGAQLLTDIPLTEAPAETPPAQSRRARAWNLIVTGARYALYGIGCYLVFVIFLIVIYRVVNPPISNLMLIRAAVGTPITRTWVPLSQISPELVRAVIVSEDGRFCEHYGIDLGAIREAIQRSASGIPRGASTISMQVTKNLFLWPSKSYVRKLVELPLTLAAEFVWPKSRMMEIYLNIAEWGPGIFGAEAAAQYHFNKPASRLSSREAALLAAALPNPVARDAGDPGPRTSRKAGVVQGRMNAGDDSFTCVLGR